MQIFRIQIRLVRLTEYLGDSTLYKYEIKYKTSKNFETVDFIFGAYTKLVKIR